MRRFKCEEVRSVEYMSHSPEETEHIGEMLGKRLSGGTVLALRGGLQPDTVMTIVTMVVAFYFGTQTEGKSNGK